MSLLRHLQAVVGVVGTCSPVADGVSCSGYSKPLGHRSQIKGSPRFRLGDTPILESTRIKLHKAMDALLAAYPRLHIVGRLSRSEGAEVQHAGSGRRRIYVKRYRAATAASSARRVRIGRQAPPVSLRRELLASHKLELSEIRRSRLLFRSRCDFGGVARAEVHGMVTWRS